MLPPSSADEKRRRRREYEREYRKKHRRKMNEQSRRWRMRYARIFRLRNVIRNRWRRITEPERLHIIDRKAYIKKHYGLTVEQYRSMFEAQGGVCAICRRPETRKGRDRYLCIDHDHRAPTIRVRGLLCHSCNNGLGCVQDNVETLREMVAYLERWQRPAGQ